MSKLYFVIEDNSTGITKFWNNEHGWCESLSLAIVFTENERKSYNLPLPSEHLANWEEVYVKWMELPQIPSKE